MLNSGRIFKGWTHKFFGCGRLRLNSPLRSHSERPEKRVSDKWLRSYFFAQVIALRSRVFRARPDRHTDRQRTDGPGGPRPHAGNSHPVGRLRPPPPLQHSHADLRAHQRLHAMLSRGLYVLRATIKKACKTVGIHAKMKNPNTLYQCI